MILGILHVCVQILSIKCSMDFLLLWNASGNFGHELTVSVITMGIDTPMLLPREQVCQFLTMAVASIFHKFGKQLETDIRST